jgi:hypothetical protein
MATFEITRAGSNYPMVARDKLPTMAIFKNKMEDGTLRPASFVNLGKLNANGYPASISVNTFNVAVARDTTREVAMVGQATLDVKFAAETEYVKGKINAFTPGSVVIIDGNTNGDGLPIAYGIAGLDDSGYVMLLDLRDPGVVTRVNSSIQATRVGTFGLVGTEV